MIQPSRLPTIGRLPASTTNASSATSASRTSTNRPATPATETSSGQASDTLVALDSSSRQKALSGNNGSNPESGQQGDELQTQTGAAGENTAAVDTAIRTDSAGLEATRSAIDNDTAGLEAAKAALENNLTELARDPEKFHAVLEKSFGGSYDKAQAENIRQQVLKGDFSWMPKIEVVNQASLQDQSGQQGGGTALGAYSQENDTIYISRELLASDPGKAAEILTEEIGHGLDARLNTSDAAGDEGDIFSRLVGGESISDAELSALRAENDSGTIVIDGKKVEVEYGFFSAITKPFKKVFNGIKKGISGIWKGIKSAFKKLMESKLFNTILMVAQFIPIPAVQVAVRVINLVKAAYAAYQGIKHGSVGAIMSGVAGVASGVGGLGASFGASQSFVNTTTRIANGARTIGAGYSAVARGDFASAASLASNWFGGQNTDTGRFLNRAGQVVSTVDRARRGDVVGALTSGADAFGSFRTGAGSGDGASALGSPRTSGTRSGIQNFVQDLRDNGTVRAIVDNVSTIRSIVNSVRDGDYTQAAGDFIGRYGPALGIDSDTRRSIGRWSSVLERVDSTRSALRGGNLAQVLNQSADLLGLPVNELNGNRIGTAFGLRDAIAENRHPDALRLAADLANSYGKPELANTFLSILTGLGIEPDSSADSTNTPVAQNQAA